MPEHAQTASPGTRWRPRGLDAWAITLASFAAIAATIGLAYSMARPVRWSRLETLAAIALAFPLHLLALSIAAIFLITIAVIFRARIAAWLFVGMLVLTMIMAVRPMMVIWQQAQRWYVPLSLRYYVVNAAHVNAGSPERDRAVIYGTAKDGTKLELDVWSTKRPNAGPRRPAILMVHGGTWLRGNRSETPDWNRWLNDIGYEVFDVEYRTPLPADRIGDVKAALGWIVAHANQYYVDPKRISVMGASAGATVAMLAAYSAGDKAVPRSAGVPPVSVKSVINLYGPVDLALLSHITSSAPPTITFLGTNDRVVSTVHATSLGAALAKANVPHVTYLLPATDHGFDVNWGGFSTQIARNTIKSFLDRFG